MPRFDVTIAGELNLDLILYGLPEELPTERELLADNSLLTLGSSSAIVAHNLAVLGARVGFLSRIGDDPLGSIALERLGAAGVDVSQVKRVPGRPTTGLTVILTHTGRRHIFTYPGTMFDMSLDDLDLGFLANSRHFHMSSFYLHRGLRSHMPQLFREMKTRGLGISLDTNDDPDDRWDGLAEVLPYVDVLLPNEREALKLTGAATLQTAVKQLAQQVSLVAVKLGAQGAMAQRGAEQVSRPALPVNAVDSVGAGDSFDAGFLYKYLQGDDLPSCLACGNLAGALSTTMPGGTEAFRDRGRVQQFFREHGC
jgi:sugar/nucleoside kinase (ribokinase family)